LKKNEPKNVKNLNLKPGIDNSETIDQEKIDLEEKFFRKKEPENSNTLHLKSELGIFAEKH